MTRTELVKDMQRYVGAGVITRSEISEYLGYRDHHKVGKLIYGLVPVVGKKYSILDVADAIMEGRS